MHRERSLHMDHQDHQDHQPIWREVRARCAVIGEYAHAREEEVPIAEELRVAVVNLLETLEQVLRADLSPDEEVEDLDPESVQGIVDTLHEYAVARGDVERVRTEAEQAEDRATEICNALITRVFDLRRRQS
jgi:hypothetical protein